MKVAVVIEFDGLPVEAMSPDSGEANPGFLVAMAALAEAKNHQMLNERIAAGDVSISFLPEMRFTVDPSEAASPAPDPGV